MRTARRATRRARPSLSATLPSPQHMTIGTKASQQLLAVVATGVARQLVGRIPHAAMTPTSCPTAVGLDLPLTFLDMWSVADDRQIPLDLTIC